MVDCLTDFLQSYPPYALIAHLCQEVVAAAQRAKQRRLLSTSAYVKLHCTLSSLVRAQLTTLDKDDDDDYCHDEGDADKCGRKARGSTHGPTYTLKVPRVVMATQEP